MTCADRSESIDDYVDDRLEASAAAELEAHVQTCQECREELEFVRRLAAEARALPRELEPGRDLWPGVAARLAQPSWYAQPAWLAAAAVLLVATTAWVTLRLAGPARPVPVADAGARLTPAAGAPLAASVADAEAEYARAAAQLMHTIDERRDRLSPETLVQVERHLEVIDTALSQIRQALREDPRNSGLVQMLASAHRKKLQVLQTVARHSTSL